MPHKVKRTLLIRGNSQLKRIKPPRLFELLHSQTAESPYAHRWLRISSRVTVSTARPEMMAKSGEASGRTFSFKPSLKNTAVLHLVLT
jgi:hypothetical protein